MKLTFGGAIEVDIETTKGNSTPAQMRAMMVDHRRRQEIINRPFPPILGGRKVQPKIWGGTIVGDTFYGSQHRPDAKRRTEVVAADSMAGYVTTL